MAPCSGRWWMAWRMVGNHAIAKNQTTAPALSRAMINSTSNKRPRFARAKAATPRGVRGCQAVGRGLLSPALSSAGREGEGLGDLRGLAPDPSAVGLIVLTPGLLRAAWTGLGLRLGRRRLGIGRGRGNENHRERIADLHDAID